MDTWLAVLSASQCIWITFHRASATNSHTAILGINGYDTISALKAASDPKDPSAHALRRVSRMYRIDHRDALENPNFSASNCGCYQSPALESGNKRCSMCVTLQESTEFVIIPF